MARACVIVLDAVGVGDLPDAGDFGTAGSSTLAHVAEAVGGLEVPTMQALGLGNVMPVPGLPAPARRAGGLGPAARALARGWTRRPGTGR